MPYGGRGEIDHNQSKALTTEIKPMILAMLDEGFTVGDCLRHFQLKESKFYRWRRQDPVWDTAIKERTSKTIAPKERNVFDPDAPLPDKGPFDEWRMKYLGRPTLRHHQVMADIALDSTVRAFFCFLPPGAGKDTTLNDLVGYVKCDDRSYTRIAWIMETEKFAMRRISERLEPYFTDPHAYDVAPHDTPGGQKPESTLIEDFGPFKWEKGIRYPDGGEVPKTTWNKSELRFLASARAPEADPDIWATGVEGQLYGARVGIMIFSDIFTQENSREPSVVEAKVDWCKGTAKSRLDSRGKLWVIGTMLQNNYGYDSLMKSWIADSAVVEHWEEGPITVTRYLNGVVVMNCKAIYADEDGEPASYWPQRFPLYDQWETPDGEHIPAEQVDWREAQEKGYARVDGLVTIRDGDPDMFEATYQQNPPSDGEAFDFNDDVLDLCDDPARSYGQVFPHERLVVAVDPARTGGAAWALLAIDTEQSIITLADYRIMSKLGLQGIKNRLIREPVTMWTPEAFCYETNHEEGVLYDSEIQRMLRDYGVEVVHHTTGLNRTDVEVGVASLAREMRQHRLRFPTATPTDRVRTQQVKQQFKNWDSASASRRPTRQRRRAPDDLCMAIWIGVVSKARKILERPARGRMRQSRPVPRSVQRRWARREQPTSNYRRGEAQSGRYADSAIQSLMVGDRE